MTEPKKVYNVSMLNKIFKSIKNDIIEELKEELYVHGSDDLTMYLEGLQKHDLLFANTHITEMIKQIENVTKQKQEELKTLN